MRLLLFICSLAFVSHSQQNTVGLIHSEFGVTEGYTLFSFDGLGKVVLINNCGEVVNNWTFDETPGMTSYLLENGNLVYSGLDSLHIRDWNNNKIWTYAASANGILQHHDIEPLPNGNILCIVTDPKSVAEQTLAGRDPALITPNFKLDKIVELEPVGTNGANIVWEWEFWDHLIQDFDSTKANYGVVEDHPELIDINYPLGNLADWTHLNSIDYNVELDQIIISARNKSELYIIDHSTSTSEAASHTGGNSGKGGDFLWRWGNPQVYRMGTNQDRKLFTQHDAQWVPNGYPNEGLISVFNNNALGLNEFSSVHLISPNSVGFNYELNGTFDPQDYSFTWDGTSISDTMYSTIKSGVSALPNGGFLICESSRGRIIELNSNQEVVWTYINPIGGATVIFPQFSVLSDFDNTVFRATKYPINHPGITSNSLNNTGILENENSETEICLLNVSLSDIKSEFFLVNPITNGQIDFGEEIFFDEIQLIDGSGRTIIHNKQLLTGSLDVSNYDSGIYLLVGTSGSDLLQHKIYIQNH